MSDDCVKDYQLEWVQEQIWALEEQIQQLQDENTLLRIGFRLKAEAKLAKAVDIDMIEQAISDVLSEGGTYRDAAEYVAQTTLAELKGDSDGV